jgi:colanic acid/amylovoran biosynthesis glycosyltransferase
MTGRTQTDVNRQAAPLRIAYLCSVYPAVSHTFVLREVNALRRLGAEIITFSIRRSDPKQLLTDADRAAYESTNAILPPRWGRLLSTHLKIALRAPRAYLATFSLSQRGGSCGLMARIWRLFYFAEAVVLWSECNRRQIRHIHVHLANVAADVALLAAYLGSTVEPGDPWSWSFTMHGPTEFADVSHFRLSEKLRRARFVICISDFARSQLMALGDSSIWGRLDVVHCGIPIEQFTNSTDEDRRHAEPTILCLGRLVPEKGQAILLQAVSLLARRGQEANVIVAGEGPSRPALERMAEELGISSRVAFLGAVGQDEIHDFYARAWVFCLPSFAEGIPVTLMEAMAMELPVVSTRIAGIPELIVDGRTGFLVAPGRPDELADVLQQLLTDPALRGEIGSRARETVIQEFNADTSAEQLHALFTERLSSN